MVLDFFTVSYGYIGGGCFGGSSVCSDENRNEERRENSAIAYFLLIKLK